MSGLRCRRVEDLLDDFINGKLPEDERIRVDMHLGTCARCTESLQLWKGFVNTARTNALDPLPPLVERRLAIAAAAERGPASKSTNWKQWVAVTSGAAAFSIMALIAVVVMHSREPVENQRPEAGNASRHETKSAVKHPGAMPGISTLADGRRVIMAAPGTNLWLADGADVQVVSIKTDIAKFRLSSGRVVAEVKAPVKGYRFIVSTPGGEVEAKGTIFSVEICDDGKEKARVIRGVVEVRKRQRSGDEPISPITLRRGEEGIVGEAAVQQAQTVDLKLDLELVMNKPENVRQELALLETTGPAVEQEAEETTHEQQPTGRDKPNSAGLADAASEEHRAAKPSHSGGETAGGGLLGSNEKKETGEQRSELEELVSVALAFRKAGNYKEAARTYVRLIDEFPSSAASRNALVSLGQLELVELGRPETALVRFSDYLAAAPTGFLAEEARLGKVRSLNRLNRFKEVVRAASEYIEAHPGGYAGAEVTRLRGDSKVRLGDCQGALRDYDDLRFRWPSSRQNDFAAKGLKACGR